MNTIHFSRLLAATLSLGVICLGGTPREAQAAELPVSYLVDQAKIKTVSDGTSLFFQLFANASCSGDPLSTTEIAVEAVALLEDVRLLKRTGTTAPAKTARLSHVLSGVSHQPVFFLKVLGAFPFPGEECQQQASPALGFHAPTGLITTWSGTLANIPVGWTLCDGSNGTPDLRERFILGVTTGVDPGATGGTDTPHSHTVNSHTHAWSDTSGGPSTTTDAGTSGSAASDSHTHVFSGTTSADSTSTGSTAHLPSYYELAFIRKL
ncbi:MAG: hypothetical protein HYZ50_01475 [Deltaproteobacteria bacterium]|nr:hypothetical protein [Deltaproteobacteria bacterium]